MLESLYITFQAFALAAGFWGIVVIAFLQEVIPPVPSTAVALSLGFLLLDGNAAFSWDIVMRSFILIGLPLGIGLTVGALFVYYAMYWGGKPLMLRYGKYIGVSWAEIERLEARMEGTSKDILLFFIPRAVPFVPGVVLNVFAGLIRWPVGPFIATTFFGTVIRGTWSGLIGWVAGSAFMKYASYIEQTNTAFFVLIVVVVVAFIVYRKYKAPKQQGDEAKATP